jgi:hypothetical protein
LRDLHSPPYNVDGAYAFLYPALGVGYHDGRVLLAFTSTPEEWDCLDMRWHGCFRSRVRARAAFDALVALFARLGHVEPTSRLPKVRLKRGARLEAFRGVPPELPAAADALLSGDSTDLLALLFDRLLESAPARRQAANVEEELRTLDDFVRKDVPPASRASDDGTLRLRARGRARRAHHRCPSPLIRAPSRGGGASQLSAMSVRGEASCPFVAISAEGSSDPADRKSLGDYTLPISSAPNSNGTVLWSSELNKGGTR